MKKFICSLLVGGLLSFAPMFSIAQSQSAMEAYLCTLNDGKSMSDLMEVVEDWNDWSDDKGITSYTAWVLNPIFMSNADLNRQALWMGVAPSFKELTATIGTWYSSGGDLLQDFNKVWTCNTHMEMTAMVVSCLLYTSDAADE